MDDRTAAEGFCRLLDGAEQPLLVAYNAQFDLNFLYYLLRPLRDWLFVLQTAPVSGCPHGVPGPAGLSLTSSCDAIDGLRAGRIRR